MTFWFGRDQKVGSIHKSSWIVQYNAALADHKRGHKQVPAEQLERSVSHQLLQLSLQLSQCNVSYHLHWYIEHLKWPFCASKMEVILCFLCFHRELTHYGCPCLNLPMQIDGSDCHVNPKVEWMLEVSALEFVAENASYYLHQKQRFFFSINSAVQTILPLILVTDHYYHFQKSTRNSRL